MSRYISQEFSKLEIVLSPQVLKDMEALVTRFETRGTHVLAFNGHLLGVYPVAFKDEDRSAFFDLFGIREEVLKDIVKHIPSINNSYIVASDPFNLLAIWVIHLSYSLVKIKRDQEAFAMNVAKYLHYRFFTSLINNFFPHGANEKIMQATIDTLTRKYDIIEYGTWRKVIEARCADLLNPKTSIHIHTLRDGQPDDKYLYVVTDVQTRIRDRVKNVVSPYYEVRAHGGEVRSRSSTAEVDGEKFLIEHVGVLDTMSTNVFAEIMNIRVFIESPMVMQMARQFSAIDAAALSQVLTRVSSMAKEQSVAKQLDVPIITHKDKSQTVGIRLLTRDIIQSTYRFCMRNNIPLDQKAKIYVRIKNVYSSSRIADEAINSVKERTGILIDGIMDTNRDATKASMRLAYILYIVFKSLKYI